MGKKPIACPNCGSENIRKKKSWTSVSLWGVLLFIAFLLTGMQDQRVSTASTALAILLIIPLLYFAVSAMWGRNRCHDCKQGWK